MRYTLRYKRLTCRPAFVGALCNVSFTSSTAAPPVTNAAAGCGVAPAACVPCADGVPAPAGAGEVRGDVRGDVTGDGFFLLRPRVVAPCATPSVTPRVTACVTAWAPGVEAAAPSPAETVTSSPRPLVLTSPSLSVPGAAHPKASAMPSASAASNCSLPLRHSPGRPRTGRVCQSDTLRTFLRYAYVSKDP